MSHRPNVKHQMEKNMENESGAALKSGVGRGYPNNTPPPSLNMLPLYILNGMFCHLEGGVLFIR